jgi:hypothetical protein
MVFYLEGTAEVAGTSAFLEVGWSLVEGAASF